VTDLLVLGGGPAGLGAAWRAARAGHRVTLFERAPVVGGAAGSFDVAGIRVDHGSHRLHPATDPRVMADLRALLGDDLQTRPRHGRIRLAGRWLAFPLRAADLVRRLPPDFALAAARDAALAPLRRAPAPGGPDDTFPAVLRAGVGPTLTERFYLPYARKLWGGDPDDLAGEQARRRVTAGSPAALLRRVLRPGRGQGQVFSYPRTGFGAIAERLADAAAAAGADLRLGTAVEAVALGPEGVAVTAGGRRTAGDLLWSTIPLPVLARLAGAPPAVLAAAGGLRTRAMVLVYPALATRRYTPFDAHYLPESWTPVTRISEPRNYRDGDDPADRTVLCAELPCDVGDATWRASDADLLGVVVDALRRAGLPDPPVRDVAVRRLPSAYPVYRRGYDVALAAVDAWATAQPRLLTFGRQGLFAHDNTHHALAMAWDAADALTQAGTVDRAAWSAARARFAAHVVED